MRMLARLASLIFLGAAASAGAQEAPPEPGPVGVWRMTEFDLMSRYRTRPVTTGFLLFTIGGPGRVSAMFECADGQIFGTLAPNGGDPRLQLSDQWSNTASRVVRWSAAGGERSGREGWSYLADTHTFRPVDFDTKIAMWESAKADSAFSVFYRDEEIVVDWPQPNDEMTGFIEACGWAEE